MDFYAYWGRFPYYVLPGGVQPMDQRMQDYYKAHEDLRLDERRQRLRMERGALPIDEQPELEVVGA